MPQIQLGNMLGVVDKRAGRGDDAAELVGSTIFTANATGTTTTIVGANAAPGTADTNVVRRGEKFKLFTAAGVLKEDTVFRITGVAVAGSTTVTFTPAAATAPVSTDVARAVSYDDVMDLEALERKLTLQDSTAYSAANLNKMTLNDKIFAYRQLIDPAGI